MADLPPPLLYLPLLQSEFLKRGKPLQDVTTSPTSRRAPQVARCTGGTLRQGWAPIHPPAHNPGNTPTRTQAPEAQPGPQPGDGAPLQPHVRPGPPPPRAGYQVSQGDATEKLAHQVAAQVAATDRRLEEASGDPHEAEKDEAHKSSKGHVSEPAAECPTSPQSLKDRMYFLDTEEKEKEDLCVGSLPQQRTNIREPQNRMKLEDKPHRLKPPD
ncbi:uncharacterized protein LOC143419086 [Maylandia zebra]|uniref:uncharacterized protein LOC143419086 n=1 Tax=Maylandia zebra TaxID=106582 RepID=UPI00403CC9B5